MIFFPHSPRKVSLLPNVIRKDMIEKDHRKMKEKIGRDFKQLQK